MASVSESELLLINGPEHISGKGNSKGRFDYQECRRLIQLILELKCERVPVAEPFPLSCDLPHDYNSRFSGT